MQLHNCLIVLAFLLAISNSQWNNTNSQYNPTSNQAINFQNIPTVSQGSYINSFPTFSSIPPVTGNLIPLSAADFNQQVPVLTTTAAYVPQQTPQLQPIQISTPNLATNNLYTPQISEYIPIASNVIPLPVAVPISNPIQAIPISAPIQAVPISAPISTPAYGQIIIDQSGVPQTQMYAPNCAQYTNGVCSRCSFRFVQGANNVCEPVNPLCATWDSNGACLTCYAGYEICESGCIMTESCAPGGTYDPNCRNTVNGTCQQCSNGYYFNQNGICTQSNPFCRTSNQGNCLSCYAGYGLNNGNCTILPDVSNNNPFCTRWQNNICQQCSNSSWLNGNICTPFDPMCAQTDRSNGNCLGCYSGYALQGGRCYVNNATQPTDLLCRRWNSNGVCAQCSNNAYFRQNMCVAADALCRTFDSQSGACLSCYAGYNLQNGRCVVIPPDAAFQNGNQYCAIWEGTTCRQCARNAYFNANRICTPNNPNCATSANNGQCLSCYNGYILQNNNCVINNSTVNVGNALCARWNGQNCVQCAQRSYNANGVCTAVNTLCNTWDSYSGFCSSCYNGYLLNGNTCQINDQNVNVNPLCKTWNGANCVECAPRSYLSNSVCTPVNDNCATWNSQNGQCTGCYNGFGLQNGACIQLAVTAPVNQNTDIYCARSDSIGQCIRCFYGFALQNGACVADFQNTSCARNPAFCRK